MGSHSKPTHRPATRGEPPCALEEQAPAELQGAGHLWKLASPAVTSHSGRLAGKLTGFNKHKPQVRALKGAKYFI